MCGTPSERCHSSVLVGRLDAILCAGGEEDEICGRLDIRALVKRWTRARRFNLTESCFLLRFRWTASTAISIGGFSVDDQIDDLGHDTLAITDSPWSLPLPKCAAGISPAGSRLGARGVERGVEMLRSGEVVNVPRRVVSESAESGEATDTSDMLLLLSSRRCGTIMEGFIVGTSILGGKGAVVPVPIACAFDMTV